MSISLTIDADSYDDLISDIRRVMSGGAGLPPMQEQPKGNRDPAPVNDNPKPRKPRGAKTEDHTKEVKDESAAGESSASASTDVATETDVSTASSTAEIPDIENVRAILKRLGATDGFGHDKVFEVLGKYKATNASSVPEARRAELIAEIEALLKGGK